MRLAVIPARGGSKRIPRKNIKPFAGKPMILWSIEAAQNSGCFDAIIVSTDDQEIAEVAKSADAQVPFFRLTELANDYAGTTEVIKHAAQWFAEHEQQPEWVCCVYATAPFVAASDLRRGFDLISNNDCDYVFTVTSYGSPIQRALRVMPTGRVEMREPECFEARSQDLEPMYHDAGQFYWGSYHAWVEEKRLFSPEAIPLVLPRYRVQDIDTEDDWRRAELMFRAWQMEQS